jgi:hypothetical protein
MVVAQRILTLATESLDMMWNRVVKDNLVAPMRMSFYFPCTILKYLNSLDTPLSIHNIGSQNPGPGLPISSDRLSTTIRNPAKRGRLDIHHHPHSRSPSDDPDASNSRSQ